jgi:hypothetical protein
MTPKYVIERGWRSGVKFWFVRRVGDTIDVARFNLKREAIDWVMKEEKKS